MVRIITDSTCDIAFDKLEKMGVEALPLSVFFGETEYKDQTELSTEEFYKKLSEAETLPTTSQINPAVFEAVFEKHIANGDEVLGLFISGNLSGTCQSARIAASSIGSEKISVVDSKNVTVGLAVLLYEAIRLRDEGLSAKEIKTHLDSMKEKVKLVASVSTLKYLCMGGRVSKTAATFGTLLGIYPILCVDNGGAKVLTKAKGKKAAMKCLTEYMTEHPVDETKAFGFAHSDCISDLNEFKDLVKDKVKNENVITCNIGCAIGTHAGPGAVAIAYIEK